LSLLKVSNVTKTYKNGERETQVLHGVSLELKKGESLAVLGGSGVGKSTLLHIIGSLDHPTSGEVFFDGESLSEKSDDELARFRNHSLGFVFQFHYLLGEFNAQENVAMPLRISGESKGESMEKSAELLKKLGLGHRLDHFPASMSGGEQQRVAIARAIIMNPELILADEPTGNLDKENSLLIQETFNQIVNDMGVGLIVVTHDRGFAKAFQRSKEMKEGRWADSF
jgi:lipoprotein-releasing system ATP-binding protein